MPEHVFAPEISFETLRRFPFCFPEEFYQNERIRMSMMDSMTHDVMGVLTLVVFSLSCHVIAPRLQRHTCRPKRRLIQRELFERVKALFVCMN